MPNITNPPQWSNFQPSFIIPGGQNSASSTNILGGGAGGGGGNNGGQISNPNAPNQSASHIPQCVPPSLLSYAIPQPGAPIPQFNGFGFPTSSNISISSRPGGIIGMNPLNMSGGSNAFLTPEQKAERAARKAARKEAKRVARENGEMDSSDDGRDSEGFKKYRCPVEGCNKSYKQANGLKYHLQ